MKLLINMNVILTNHFVGADIIRPKTSSQPNVQADNIRPYKQWLIKITLKLPERKGHGKPCPYEIDS
jgi:hypothetical protein